MCLSPVKKVKRFALSFAVWGIGLFPVIFKSVQEDTLNGTFKETYYHF